MGSIENDTTKCWGFLRASSRRTRGTELAKPEHIRGWLSSGWQWALPRLENIQTLNSKSKVK